MTEKISDKDLKAPDTLQMVFMKALNYISENRQKFYIIAGVVSLMFLSAAGWYLYRLDYEKSAQLLFTKAQNSVLASRDNFQEIIKSYKDVATQYPSSQAAMMAHYRLGSLHYNLNDMDGSIASYQAFLKISPEDSDLFTLAYAGLGYCYESKGDLKNALAYFEKADKTKAGSNFESMNYRNIGRIYEAMNERAKALEYYQKALGKTSDPFVERFIKRKIASLG